MPGLQPGVDAESNWSSSSDDESDSGSGRTDSGSDEDEEPHAVRSARAKASRLSWVARLLGAVPHLGCTSTGRRTRSSPDQQKKWQQAGSWGGTGGHDSKQPQLFQLELTDHCPDQMPQLSPAHVAALKPTAHHLKALCMGEMPLCWLSADLVRAMGDTWGPHLTHLRLGSCGGVQKVGSWGHLLTCLARLRQLDVLVHPEDRIPEDLGSLGQACKDSGRALQLRIFIAPPSWPGTALREGWREQLQAQSEGGASIRGALLRVAWFSVVEAKGAGSSA